MKTIYLAVTLTGEKQPSTEEFIKNAGEQISFVYDRESFSMQELAITDSVTLPVYPSEAVYALLAVLSTQPETIKLSRKKIPSEALALANQLIEANRWTEPRPDWQRMIEFPSIVEEINNRKKEMVGKLFGSVAPARAEKTPDDEMSTTDDQKEKSLFESLLGGYDHETHLSSLPGDKSSNNIQIPGDDPQPNTGIIADGDVSVNDEQAKNAGSDPFGSVSSDIPVVNESAPEADPFL